MSHPYLDLVAFETYWPAPLGDRETPQSWSERARLDADPSFGWDDTVKKAVRDLLRHGGFKPNGRGKPCSEYIRSAVARDAFPWINPAIDATNLTVLHTGLPVSTLDLDRLDGPLCVTLPEKGTTYVFNASGQTIDVGGLLCLQDAAGPCSNPVKDSQRAKTTPTTTRTLTLIWGTNALPGRAARAADLHERWNHELGARTERRSIAFRSPPASPTSEPQTR